MMEGRVGLGRTRPHAGAARGGDTRRISSYRQGGRPILDIDGRTGRRMDGELLLHAETGAHSACHMHAEPDRPASYRQKVSTSDMTIYERAAWWGCATGPGQPELATSIPAGRS